MAMDLFDSRLRDDIFCNVWQDEDIIQVNLNFMSFSLPRALFHDFVRCLAAADERRMALEQGNTTELTKIDALVSNRKVLIEKTFDAGEPLERCPWEGCICDYKHQRRKSDG